MNLKVKYFDSDIILFHANIGVYLCLESSFIALGDVYRTSFTNLFSEFLALHCLLVSLRCFRSSLANKLSVSLLLRVL